MPAWEAHDPTLTRPIAASLAWCAELLGVDLDALQEAAAHLEPYLRVDGTRVWSLMQLERQRGPRLRSGPRRLPRPSAATGHPDPAPVTDKADHCSFCGSMTGPFTRSRDSSRSSVRRLPGSPRPRRRPYPVMTRA